MLQTFYNSFGFFGSILISFFGFIFFIFWIAGIAGIAQLPESRSKNIKLIISAIFPPFPFVWLFIDMGRQKKHMQEEL
ncbi:MAG: hypothetical protein R3222_05830 [Balneolaceae bacterium]|nr:hypothetical protein [Balneolaceae bacterium]